MFLKLSLMNRFILPLAVLVPHDTNVAVDKFGFDPPTGSHQLPIFLKYSVHLKLVAHLVHM